MLSKNLSFAIAGKIFQKKQSDQFYHKGSFWQIFCIKVQSDANIVESDIHLMYWISTFIDPWEF